GLAGVHAVMVGEDIGDSLRPMEHGVPAPGISWYPLAVNQTRYVGEWVGAVVADDRYVAEDAAEQIVVEYEPIDAVLNAEQALANRDLLVHREHGTNVLYQRTFTWGDVDSDFADAAHTLEHNVYWGRSSTVPIETFGVVAQWDPGRAILDVWASVQMPKYAEQIAAALRLPVNGVRVHYDVDVGGSYGVKRGLKHAVLAGYLAMRLGQPVRLLEDRQENMSGGDAHGPDRAFAMKVAFEADGTIRSWKIRALDDCGAFPGRAPLQLGKPVGAIVGPYRIASVEYEAISVCTNKTGQVAVRGFGQAPTNYAMESAMDAVADALGLDPIELRRRNYIGADEFPYRIPSGTEYDSGDYEAVTQKVLALADYQVLRARVQAMREAGRIVGVGVASCLEPGGGNAAFEPLLNPKNTTTTWMESCVIKVDRDGGVTALIATSTAGQGHETLTATVVGEALGIEPESIRVLHTDTLSALPGNTPVASRMAIMLGGAAAGAANALIEDLKRIASFNLEVPIERLRYDGGDVEVVDDPNQSLAWLELVTIAHRHYHQMPEGMQPGLQASYVYQVPNGRNLPTADGLVQMYPCYAFEIHIPLVEVDRLTGVVSILEYYVAHDCGTMINPDIVHGMLFGGIAHGIGAALYEEFRYDDSGQLLAGTLVDYLLPSTLEVPPIKVADHCTPSPLTSLGQKGAGEAGYMGAPAAVASAVNDALKPLGGHLGSLPMRLGDIAGALQASGAWEER
ncbi:MAG: xanthine dehydrogenase family protein molybdopterin-binding subunit, partial [Gammaproteobacteria bacterium]|nr:xanthine dehydrogenase family protein molybdopterin-binding subunit [Gammaproteobacteria bacterium]